MVLKVINGSLVPFTYEGITLYARTFQNHSARDQICNSFGSRQRTPLSLTTPTLQRLPPITQSRFGLLPFRSPLLRESSLFLEVLRCFSSLRAPRLAYVFSQR